MLKPSTAAIISGRAKSGPGVGAHEVVPGRLLRRKRIRLVLKSTDRDTRHLYPRFTNHAGRTISSSCAESCPSCCSRPWPPARFPRRAGRRTAPTRPYGERSRLLPQGGARGGVQRLPFRLRLAVRRLPALGGLEDNRYPRREPALPVLHARQGLQLVTVSPPQAAAPASNYVFVPSSIACRTASIPCRGRARRRAPSVRARRRPPTPARPLSSAIWIA